MKYLFIVMICFMARNPLLAQTDTIRFGSGTSFYLGSQASFYMGGNAGFEGTFDNKGTLISNRNFDPGTNTQIGNIGFVGASDQAIFGDTLFIDSLGVNKSQHVVIRSDQVRVTDRLEMISGGIRTSSITDLLILGSAGLDGTGYILGSLAGIVPAQGDLTFPMGAMIDGEGFKNYITFEETTPGTVLAVYCIENPDSLLVSEEMIGIAEQMEWRVRTISGSTPAIVRVDFSGLDLVNFSNGNRINASTYEPALVVLQKGDTLFQILESTEATTENGNTSATSGKIVATTNVTLDTTITRLAVSWIPTVDGPEFYVPNAFSPAGVYEENQTFRPYFAGGEVTSIVMSVFNAYNSEVYNYSESGANLDLSLIGWDGFLQNGLAAEEGVYYYTIRLIADGQAYEKTSSVLLVK